MVKRLVMRKNLFVGLILLAVLSLTFVSANWFSDLFGDSRLTGKITQGVCGNGILEAGELCDGEDVLGSINSCEDFGFASGSLSCSSNCLFDTSKCVAKTTQPIAICGNGIVESGEGCDAGSQNGIVCSPSYGSSCNYCSSQCLTTTIQGARCGDGVCNGGESSTSCLVDCPNTPANQTPTNNTKINQNPSNLLAGGAISGLFYSTHIDDFENFAPENRYALLVNNKFYNLRLQNDPQIPSGTSVTVYGNLQGNNLIVASSLQANSAALSSPPSSQNIVDGNKLLLIPVQFTDSPAKPFTSSEIQNRFYGDFNEFYKENSYGKKNWQITASDWISLPYSSEELNYNGSNENAKGIFIVATDILSLAKQKISLNSYDQILLIYNDPTGSRGYGTAGYAFGRAFDDDSFYDLDITVPVAVAGAFYLTFSDESSNDQFELIAIHEVGHNLLINDYFLLPHANTLVCSQSTISYPNDPPCIHLEYGNQYDAMGASTKGKHFNSYLKEAEGWFDSINSIQLVSSSGRYSLMPYETNGGTKALKIPLQKQNGQFYYIEYRTNTGFDYPGSDYGLVVTLVLPTTENYLGPSGYNYLIAAKDFPGRGFIADNYALKLGDKYTDEYRKIIIGPITKMDSNDVDLDICLGELCFISTPNNCTDSDGYDLFTSGNVTDNNGTYQDYCATPQEILEYTCGVGQAVSTRVLCDNGCLNCENKNSCSNGACESVNQNQTATCNFISANWSMNEAIEGEIVYLSVQGDNCKGQSVSFVVWEYDPLGGDDAVSVNPASVTFSESSATGSWVAEWQDDGLGGDPEYYFDAQLTTDASVKARSNQLIVSRAIEPVCGDGSVNQASEQCDDGNTNGGDDCSSTCQTETPTCTDSDNGNNPYIKGTLNGFDRSQQQPNVVVDYCENSNLGTYLREYYCDESSSSSRFNYNWQDVNCAYGCSDGACITQPTCTPGWECTDWSECLDSLQTRTCNDLNGCGTLLNKPKESQSCTSEPTLPPQTFFDNVRNIIKNLFK